MKSDPLKADRASIPICSNLGAGTAAAFEPSAPLFDGDRIAAQLDYVIPYRFIFL